MRLSVLKSNAYINLGFILNWQLHPQWKLARSVDFTHFSNGNTHYPNGGLNVIGGRSRHCTHLWRCG